ncbi:MAG: L-threonylcarbamoyladenylate synthase, partial [Patescibacteria group bacterium]
QIISQRKNILIIWQVYMNKYAKLIRAGKIGVMPTDTIYGLVGQALNKETVEQIYAVRKRNPSKPMIILINSIKDLALFGVDTDEKLKNILSQLWPGKISIILPITNDSYLEKLNYLHRGSKTLAFRLPDDEALIDLLVQTGPLVAPSANLEGMSPATTIDEAKKYFGDSVDFYVDEGKITSHSSRLIKIENSEIIELRK